MSRILKRVLTRKSVLGFGYQDIRDLSVQMLLDLNRKNDLIDIYYNLEKIDFMPDILDELGIIEEFRLIKPSKDKELRSKFYIYLINNRNEEEDFKIMAKRFHDKKRISKSKERGFNYSVNSKANNQRKNHGK